jgi:hypothetical protein
MKKGIRPMSPDKQGKRKRYPVGRMPFSITFAEILRIPFVCLAYQSIAQSARRRDRASRTQPCVAPSRFNSLSFSRSARESSETRVSAASQAHNKRAASPPVTVFAWRLRRLARLVVSRWPAATRWILAAWLKPLRKNDRRASLRDCAMTVTRASARARYTIGHP